MLKPIIYCFISTILLNSAGIYDNFTGCYNDMYIVEKGGEEFYIDKNNNYIKPFEFESISLTDGSYCFIYEDNTYINKIENGIFDSGTTYTGGLKTEEQNSLTGVVDYEGNTVIPFEYDSIIPYGENFKCEKGNKVEIITRDNKVIESYDKDMLVISKKGEEYALINSDNEIIIPYTSERLTQLSEKYIRRGNEMEFTPNELYDTDGNIIISKEDNYAVFNVYGDELCVMDLTTFKFGIINSSKEIIVPFKYDILYKPDADQNVYAGKLDGKNIVLRNGKQHYIKFDFTVIKTDKNGVYLKANGLNKWITVSDRGVFYFDIVAKEIHFDDLSMVIHTFTDKYVVLNFK